MAIFRPHPLLLHDRDVSMPSASGIISARPINAKSQQRKALLLMRWLGRAAHHVAEVALRKGGPRSVTRLYIHKHTNQSLFPGSYPPYPPYPPYPE